MDSGSGGQNSAGAASQRDGDGREWIPAGAFILVIISLLVLAVIPGLLLQRVSRLTQDVSTTYFPVYDAIRDYAFAMEQRIASARSSALAGDSRYDAPLAEARIAEEQSASRLRALAPRISPDFQRHLDEMRRYSEERDSLEAYVIRGGEELAVYRSLLPRFDALRDSVVVRLDNLRREVELATEARIAEESRWAGLQRWLSVVISAAALLAALLVGWFAWRQRRLRRELEAALQEANRQRALADRRGDDLERATEARVRLLRGITHDVKNPLGAAKGYADLLQMGVLAPLVPEQARFVEGIQRSIGNALAIIADLLDLARGDSGGLSVNRVEVDLAALTRAAAEDHRPAAEAAGHVLEILLPSSTLCVHTDPARVEQVLGNLISNAMKYTPPPGRITVSVRSAARDGSPHGASWATITVSDTGPGIPAEQRDAIFEEFTRLDDTGEQTGHGLGLAIARRVARLLGGDLTVEDRPGGGASFVLALPVRHADRLL